MCGHGRELTVVCDVQEEEHDPHFEPVIKLTQQVETKTNEEDEEVVFKMCVLILPVRR